MRRSLGDIGTIALVICALITTGAVIHREFFASPLDATRISAQKPYFIEGWRSKIGEDAQLGPGDAAVQFVEFADFECPYCGDFHRKLKWLRERHPTQVSLTYIHFPLPGHRFALAAARAAECARDQGRFEAMYDRLFDEQDMFGLKSWREFAEGAGVPDLPGFDLCIGKVDTVPRIEHGKQLAGQLNVKATPTVMVNGWMLDRPPTADQLDEMVKSVLAGKSPVIVLNRT